MKKTYNMSEKIKGSLSDQGEKFTSWLGQLKQVTADKLKCEPEEVLINSDAAYLYFKDGYTPTQCFREEW